MAKKNVMEFIKTHKKEIAIATGSILIGTIGFVITKKKLDGIENVSKTLIETWKDVDHSAITVGEITECTTNGEMIDVIINNISVKELATLSNQLPDVEGITPDSNVSAMIWVS